jgi:hypothetical protein
VSARRSAGVPSGVPRASAPLPLSEAAKRLRRPGGRPRKAVISDIGNSGAVAGQADALPATPPRTWVSGPAVPEVCPIPPRLLDLEGAAAYLSVSTWTVRDWAAAGVIERVRLPGGSGSQDGALHRLLFDRVDLDRLVERGKDDNVQPARSSR